MRIAFLGCGFITGVHSRHLQGPRRHHRAELRQPRRRQSRGVLARYGGAASYGDYAAAIADPDVDAVVIAVPPQFHLDLTLQALAAGKHVLVEKPAFPTHGRLRDGARGARPRAARRARRRERSLQAAGGRLRRLLADGAIGEMVFAHFTTIAQRLKTADDWRNDEAMAGGDAFFEEGIHWLHLAGSLGPSDHVDAHGYRPSPSRGGPGHARQEHDGGVPATTTAPSARCTTRARSRRCFRACGCRSCSAARASSRSSRTALFVSCAAAGCRA